MWKAYESFAYFIYTWPFFVTFLGWRKRDPFNWHESNHLGAKTEVRNFEMPFNFHNRDLLIMCLVGRNEMCKHILMWKVVGTTWMIIFLTYML